jgi:hypothetical protein
VGMARVGALAKEWVVCLWREGSVGGFGVEGGAETTLLEVWGLGCRLVDCHAGIFVVSMVSSGSSFRRRSLRVGDPLGFAALDEAKRSIWRLRRSSLVSSCSDVTKGLSGPVSFEYSWLMIRRSMASLRCLRWQRRWYPFHGLFAKATDMGGESISGFGVVLV